MNTFSSGYSDNPPSKQFHFSEDTDERLSSSSNLGWRLLLFVIICVALMIADQLSQFKPGDTAPQSTFDRGMARVHQGIKIAILPFELAASAPTEIGDWLDNATTSRSSLQATNERLLQERAILSEGLQRLASLEAENKRLKRFLNASQSSDVSVLVAEIVSLAQDPYQQRIQINKGLQENIYPGQPLIDSNGVIGQISRVNPFTSWAILISDSDHAISVEVRRNGLRTVARGIGEPNRLLLPFLPLNADIREGDELWTSGLGGIFPAGYKVGTVNQIGRDISGKFAEVYAVPAANLDRGRQLLLLTPETKAIDTEKPFNKSLLRDINRFKPNTDETNPASEDEVPPPTSTPSPQTSSVVPSSLLVPSSLVQNRPDSLPTIPTFQSKSDNNFTTNVKHISTSQRQDTKAYCVNCKPPLNQPAFYMELNADVPVSYASKFS